MNPNNPDGRFIDHAKLAAALPPLKRGNGLLIVDEAFADADESHSILPHVARLDYTLVLRSVGKFFGAGGVRLGFAITSHPVVGRLRAALGAWPVSAQAIAFGEAALADEAWTAAQRTRLAEAAGQLDAALAEAGCRVIGGTALFRLAEHPLSGTLFAHLARRGILTRPFKNRSALRFGLPASPEELERLREALTDGAKGMRDNMRGLLAAGILALSASAALADDIGCVSTTFRLVGRNDQVCISAFDDPKVPGVACHISQARTGGAGGSLGLAEDPSRFSISCRQIGPVTADIEKLGEHEKVYAEHTSIFFKHTNVFRIVDKKRNTLVYLAISDKIVEGSPQNAISTVPIMPWGAAH